MLIRVIDTNNHRPEFSQNWYAVNVSEDQPAGTEVLQISAVDRDEKNKLTFTLLSSTDPFSLRKFRLDPGTGTLYTAEPLDHETMHRHVLTVMVWLNDSWQFNNSQMNYIILSYYKFIFGIVYFIVKFNIHEIKISLFFSVLKHE